MTLPWTPTLIPSLVIGLALVVSPAAQAAGDKAAKARAAFDLMDRQDFLDGIERAGDCTQRNDFACAENALAEIKDLASSPEQDQLWQQATRELQNGRKRVAQEEAYARAQREAEQMRVAQQQQAQQQGGYQWGKLAALAVGSSLGGLDQLDSQTKANLLIGMVKDGMAGQQGISNFQSAAAAEQQRLGIGGGTPGGAGGAGGSGNWTPHPNTLAGSAACKGYTDGNYQQYYEAHKQEDPQLHSMCAAAFNYYSAYLNARRQGYSKEQAQPTYEMFQKTARVATEYASTAAR